MDVFLSSLLWQIAVATLLLHLELHKWQYQSALIKYVLPMVFFGGKLGSAIMSKLDLDLDRLKELARDPNFFTLSIAVILPFPIIVHILLLPCWFSTSLLAKSLSYSAAVACPVLQSVVVSVLITYHILIKVGVVQELKPIFFPNMEKMKDFVAFLSLSRSTPDYIKQTLKQLDSGQYLETLAFLATPIMFVSLIVGDFVISKYFHHVLILSRKIGEAKVTSLPLTKALLFYLQLTTPFAILCVPITVPTAYALTRLHPYTQYRIIKATYYITMLTIMIVLIKMTG